MLSRSRSAKNKSIENIKQFIENQQENFAEIKLKDTKHHFRKIKSASLKEEKLKVEEEWQKKETEPPKEFSQEHQEIKQLKKVEQQNKLLNLQQYEANQAEDKREPKKAQISSSFILSDPNNKISVRFKNLIKGQKIFKKRNKQFQFEKEDLREIMKNEHLIRDNFRSYQSYLAEKTNTIFEPVFRYEYTESQVQSEMSPKKVSFLVSQLKQNSDLQERQEEGKILFSEGVVKKGEIQIEGLKLKLDSKVIVESIYIRSAYLSNTALRGDFSIQDQDHSSDGDYIPCSHLSSKQCPLCSRKNHNINFQHLKSFQSEMIPRRNKRVSRMRSTYSKLHKDLIPQDQNEMKKKRNRRKRKFSMRSRKLKKAVNCLSQVESIIQVEEGEGEVELKRNNNDFKGMRMRRKSIRKVMLSQGILKTRSTRRNRILLQ